MFQNERPNIKIPYSRKYLIIDILSLLGIIAIPIAALIASKYMPETIAIHFDIQGNPDGFEPSEKFFESSLIMASILLPVWALLTFLRLIPRYFNYPVEITKENAEKQYKIAVDMVYNLKLWMVILFMFVETLMIWSAFSQNAHYAFYFIMIPMLMIVYLVVSFISKSVKNK